jgi:hypothetical protein
MVKGLSASLRRRLSTFGLGEDFHLEQDVTTKHPNYIFHVSVRRSESASLIARVLKSTGHVDHASRNVCDNRNVRGVLARERTRAPREIA